MAYLTAELHRELNTLILYNNHTLNACAIDLHKRVTSGTEQDAEEILLRLYRAEVFPGIRYDELKAGRARIQQKYLIRLLNYEAP